MWSAGYVAILGRPNAGKSTLVNALVGQKLSIVTAKAQTTRHRILSLVNEPGYQMILLDTPGIMNVPPPPPNSPLFMFCNSAAPLLMLCSLS
jgi:GTP-binding protein Era